ncbi:MAG: hypothetical protein JSW54_03800, partial [Fidelibacterota bacterium]
GTVRTWKRPTIRTQSNIFDPSTTTAGCSSSESWRAVFNWKIKVGNIHRMRTKVMALLLTVALAVLSGYGESEAREWIALFDGQTLDGWSAHSRLAGYKAMDVAIVGTTSRIAMT